MEYLNPVKYIRDKSRSEKLITLELEEGNEKSPRSTKHTKHTPSQGLDGGKEEVSQESKKPVWQTLTPDFGEAKKASPKSKKGLRKNMPPGLEGGKEKLAASKKRIRQKVKKVVLIVVGAVSIVSIAGNVLAGVSFLQGGLSNMEALLGNETSTDMTPIETGTSSNLMSSETVTSTYETPTAADVSTELTTDVLSTETDTGTANDLTRNENVTSTDILPTGNGVSIDVTPTETGISTDLFSETGKSANVTPTEINTLPDLMSKRTVTSTNIMSKRTGESTEKLPTGATQAISIKSVTPTYMAPTGADNSTRSATTLEPFCSSGSRVTGSLLTPDKEQYIPLPVDLTKMTRKCFIFSVKASSDAHILLYKSNASLTKDIYEIYIGGHGNRFSAIRDRQQRKAKVKVSTKDILSSAEMRPFWISWGEDTIRVGRGSVNGKEGFMKYSDQTFTPVNFLAVHTGFGSSGEWTYYYCL